VNCAKTSGFIEMPFGIWTALYGPKATPSPPLPIHFPMLYSIFYFSLFRPHRSTTYVDAAYCYRPCSVVCLSVSLSVCHASEPCKNSFTDPDAVWVEDSGGPKVPCIRWRSISPIGRGNFEGGKGRPIVKYRDTQLTGFM